MTVVQPLPRRDALLYASGSFAGNLLSRITGAWLFYFYADGGSDRTLVPVWAIGVILTVTSILGTFDDPLIGYWSDRTRSRWGRRLPFIVLATPAWAVVFVLLWTPPHDQESVANAVYLFAVIQIWRIVATLSGGPMEALLPEIAPLNTDRIRIVVGQVVFATLSAVVALVVAGPVIDLLGFQTMALLAAALALASRYLALVGVWRHARRDVAPATMALSAAFRATFGNDQFLYFLPTFVLFNMGITLLTAALPFFVEEVIRPGEGRVGTYSALVTAVPIGVVLLSLPFVQRLALRRGKAWVYARMMLFGALYLPLLFFMGFLPGIPALAQAMLLLAPVGLCMAGVFVFPNALMADIIDYDTLRTGMRRKAIYYGMQNLIENIVVALHAAVLAGLLALGGAADDPLGIRLVGPVAGASIFAGYMVFRGYRLPDTITPETMPLSVGLRARP